MGRTSLLFILVTALGLFVFAPQPFARAQQTSPSAFPTRSVSYPQGNETFPPNPGFDTGSFTDWSLSGAPGVWTVTSADKHTGSYAAHAWLSGVATYTVSTLTSSLFSVVGNQRTSLVFWEKAPQVVNGAKLCVITKWYTFNKTWLGLSGWCIRNVPVPNWTRYEIPITLPTNAAFLQVQLDALAYPDDAIEVYVDDFSSSVVTDPILFLPLVSR